MIKNELRYKGKILNYDEKSKIISNITLNVFLLRLLYTLLIICIASVILIFILAFINTTWASASLGTTFASLFLAIIAAFLLERDVISKELNDKLYIYFDLLKDFIEEGKSLSKIEMIKRKLTRYLGTLENNVNNVFIFKSSELEPQLIQDIKKFLDDDLIYLLKNEKNDIILELMANIKDTYLNAEGLTLTKNMERVHENEHSLKMEILKSTLNRCEFEKQSLLTDTDQGMFLVFSAKLIKFVSSIYTLVIVAMISIIYMNVAEEYTILSANITLVSLFVSLIIFIVSRKK
ncbi:hypothetical protein CXK86_20130 [Paenibacillus sp. BGI2013]|uniref:hypothetical protein n=1 Tax=Paenibacillus sp. BGI2013 TaxID=2058902 RepID=UPI000C6D42D4|nr:hypothetical protein [Paenibacillus sp. BGI2013]PKQ89361.1 hypothetical protein CXK86_20130 [Paenibacillus sp. BGI2013]